MNRTLLALAALATAVLSACSTTENSVYVKPEPTYQDAEKNPFVGANREAIQKLLAGLDLKDYQRTPLLVATVVNVNDLRKTAPLGRTLSEQYASHLVNSGLLVKELKLRGDIFVREETGELMLSREVKDIAKMHSAGVVLVGTFSPAANVTFVSLKLVMTDTGQIIRGHDYALPNNADVTKLLSLK